MKQKICGSNMRYGFGLMAVALCLFSAATAQAGLLTWDPTGLGSAGGGAGTWDETATTANWYDSSLGLPDVVWTAGSDAEFNNAGGAVGVATGGVTANNITINGTGYAITTGTTNTITLTGTTPTITVNSASVNFGSSSTNPAIIAGTAGLTKDGPGTLNIEARGGGNTYTGGTTILGGTLSINREWALGATPAALDYSNIVMKNGTTFRYGLTTSPSSNRGIRLDGTATFSLNVTSSTLSWGAPITGAGGLNITSTGASLRLGSNINTYSGDTVVQSGTISLGGDNPLPYFSNTNNGVNGTGAGNVYLWSGATIYVNNFNIKINGLNDGVATAHGAGIVNQAGSSSKTFTLGDNNANGNFSGIVQGGKLGLTKIGTGTQTLSGANNYGSTTANTTSVNGGALYVNGSIGGLSVNNLGTFSPIGATVSNSILNVRGPLNFQTGSTEIFDLNSPTGYDQITTAPGNSGATAGSVTLAGTLQVNLNYTPAATDKFWIVNNDLVDAVSGVFAGLPEGSTVFTSGGLPWNIYYAADTVSGNLTGGNDVVIAPVPEPATIVLLAMGGLLMLLRWRRR